MPVGALLDAGPLVAYLYPRDRHHPWAVEQFEAAKSPFLTCEAALTEASFLTRRNGQSPVRVLQLLDTGVARVGLDLEEEVYAIQVLMARYANVPMSLADACLVRMSEMTRLPICTLDTDFTVYRAHGRQALELITPAGLHGLHES